MTGIHKEPSGSKNNNEKQPNSILGFRASVHLPCDISGYHEIKVSA